MHGEAAGYAYGVWVVAIFNVGLFLFFMLSFLKPRGSQEWRSMGVVTAFLVALFAEMYGFPLTIYLLSGWLGDAYPVLQPFSHKYGHLWVVVFGGSTTHFPPLDEYECGDALMNANNVSFSFLVRGLPLSL